MCLLSPTNRRRQASQETGTAGERNIVFLLLFPRRKNSTFLSSSPGSWMTDVLFACSVSPFKHYKYLEQKWAFNLWKWILNWTNLFSSSSILETFFFSFFGTTLSFTFFFLPFSFSWTRISFSPLLSYKYPSFHSTNLSFLLYGKWQEKLYWLLSLDIPGYFRVHFFPYTEFILHGFFYKWVIFF